MLTAVNCHKDQIFLANLIFKFSCSSNIRFVRNKDRKRKKNTIIDLLNVLKGKDQL